MYCLPVRHITGAFGITAFPQPRALLPHAAVPGLSGHSRCSGLVLLAGLAWDCWSATQSLSTAVRHFRRRLHLSTRGVGWAQQVASFSCSFRPQMSCQVKYRRCEQQKACLQMCTPRCRLPSCVSWVLVPCAALPHPRSHRPHALATPALQALAAHPVHPGQGGRRPRPLPCPAVCGRYAHCASSASAHSPQQTPRLAAAPPLPCPRRHVKACHAASSLSNT